MSKFTKEQSANYLAGIMTAVIQDTNTNGLPLPVVTSFKQGNTKVFTVSLEGQTKWWDLEIFNGVRSSHVRNFLVTKIIGDFKYNVSFPNETTVKIG